MNNKLNDTTMKHTKGDWKVLGESVGNYISVGTDQQQICKVNWGKEDTDYDFANAKLIASAPEMLKVLKIVQEYFLKIDNKHCDHRITEAIKKATE